jgi:hypothetical protein
MEMRPAVVPVISLKTLIDAIPHTLQLSMCKTDTNGNDVYVIESAGRAIRRCLRVTCEVVGPHDGTGPPDQYERVVHMMHAQGFRFADGFPSEKRLNGSYDLRFIRRDVMANEHNFY